MPDAFICANDHTAIGVCIGLRQCGLEVPKDVIVTGFDDIPYAETFYPTITTVSQDYEKIGSYSMELLLGSIKDGFRNREIIIPSPIILNESCGCKMSSEAENRRHEYCIESYKAYMNDIMYSIHISEISNILFNSPLLNEVQDRVIKIYQNNHWYEGDEFYFILDCNFLDCLKKNRADFPRSFGKMMYPLVFLKDGKIKITESFERNMLIPEFSKGSSAGFFTFVPLHHEDFIFGYLVMSDARNIIESNSIYYYKMEMGYNIEKYRQNNRLDKMNRVLLDLSTKDSLTGLYNRFGFDKYGIPLFTDANIKGKKCALIFADINKMKYINDNFGHLKGDLAIRIVSDAILEECPKEWISMRFGGDEFLSLGVCENEETCEKIKNCIIHNLEEKIKDKSVIFDLSVSIGFILTNPFEKLSFSDYINKADETMYLKKHGSIKIK